MTIQPPFYRTLNKFSYFEDLKWSILKPNSYIFDTYYKFFNNSKVTIWNIISTYMKYKITPIWNMQLHIHHTYQIYFNVSFVIMHLYMYHYMEYTIYMKYNPHMKYNFHSIYNNQHLYEIYFQLISPQPII